MFLAFRNLPYPTEAGGNTIALEKINRKNNNLVERQIFVEK
jgi:hypothetical protein